MIKVLFVCHGNICRSPMAEFVFRDMVKREGLSDRISAASAATSREDIGNPVHRGTQKKLAEHGICTAGKYAVLMTKKDYRKYDYIIGMDRYNLREMQRVTGGDPLRKLSLLLDYTDRPGDIADPWYTGNFDETYRDVKEGCEGLLSHIRETDLGR